MNEPWNENEIIVIWRGIAGRIVGSSTYNLTDKQFADIAAVELPFLLRDLAEQARNLDNRL